MVAFDLWKEAFVFAVIYGIMISVPCFFVGKIGCRMLDQLGNFPSKTPFIQMSIVYQLIILEVITFTLLIGFYQVFSSGQA